MIQTQQVNLPVENDDDRRSERNPFDPSDRSHSHSHTSNLFTTTTKQSQISNFTPPSRPIVDSSRACNHASAPVVCRCMDQSNSQLLGVLGLLGTFAPKLPLPLRGSSPPRNTLFLKPSPLIVPNGISIGSAVFAWVPNALLWEKTKLPLPLGFRHPTGGEQSHGHMQHAQKLVKIVCVVPKISSQTDRHTHRHSHTHYNTSQPLPRVK